MTTIQIIELHGYPVAVVAGYEAIIAAHLTGADRARVQAKALYAIEIAAGTRCAPYTDAGAERYADAVQTLLWCRASSFHCAACAGIARPSSARVTTTPAPAGCAWHPARVSEAGSMSASYQP
jgi:hypothetical protein